MITPKKFAIFAIINFLVIRNSKNMSSSRKLPCIKLQNELEYCDTKNFRLKTQKTSKSNQRILMTSTLKLKFFLTKTLSTLHTTTNYLRELVSSYKMMLLITLICWIQRTTRAILRNGEFQTRLYTSNKFPYIYFLLSFRDNTCPQCMVKIVAKSQMKRHIERVSR